MRTPALSLLIALCCLPLSLAAAPPSDAEFVRYSQGLLEQAHPDANTPGTALRVAWQQRAKRSRGRQRRRALRNLQHGSSGRRA
jgi:hypothetical protein